jgi:peptidoglycan/LPS O-acetylase OafA/YrhL
VVAYHGGSRVPGGFTGVDVFFAISGFVITGTLLRELEATGRISLPRFYARRVKRLLPALALMVVGVAALGTLASPVATQHVGALTGVFASFFSANVYLYRVATDYFSPSASLNPLLHTWTLAVEEQFYVAFPTLLLASWWLGKRSARLRTMTAATSITVVSAASLALALATGGGHELSGISWPQQFAFFSSPTRAWEFGAGAILALLAPSATRLPAAVSVPLGWLGLAAILAGAVAIHGVLDFPAKVALLPVAGTAALLAAGSARETGVSRLLGLRPLTWIGDLSYSWYLWHWPLIVFGRALLPTTPGVSAAAAVVSLIPAWASFRFVENPIRIHRSISGRKVLAVAAVCIVGPVGACAGLDGARRAIAHNSAVRQWTASQRLHADVIRGCSTGAPLARCTWIVPRPLGRIVLVGDSNAGQFTEPFVRAAKRAQFSATVVTRSACPFAELSLVGFHDAAACQRFVTDTLRLLLRVRPSLVIIANRSDEYVGDRSIALRNASGETRRGAVAKAEVLRHGLRSVIAPLTAVGIPVVVIHPVPALPLRDLGSCAVVRLLTDSCAESLPRRTVDKRRRRALTAENAALAGLRLATALDFEQLLCRPTSCSSVRGEKVMYRDAQHLTIAGALTLTSAFYHAIRAHALAAR